MFSIEQRLCFDNAASPPRIAQGWWFPGLEVYSERWRDVLVEVLLVQESLGESSVYRIDAGEGVELFFFGKREFSVASTLGGLPMVNWMASHTSAGNDCQLWTPYNAEIYPSIATSRQRLWNDVVFLWHPVRGLLRLESENRFEALSCFAPPSMSDQRWQTPPEVVIRFPIIRDLRAEQEADLEMFLVSGNEDIGTDAGQLAKATRDDSTGPLTKAKQRVLQWIDQRASKKDASKKKRPQKDGVKEPPRTASNANVGSGVGTAGGMIHTVTRALAETLGRRLQAERERQIEKLLHWMRDDPDRALRYALPIGEQGGHRGFAMPGAKLFERAMDFSLSGLRGGGPVDSWNLSFDLRQRLRQSYYQQFERAKAAGRYRRAAYIAAHLLGDLRLAAECLEQGGHHSEAGAVYRDKLQQTGDAARCFANAGQWEQAVELYRASGELEKAGDLLRDVGEEASAIEAYEGAAKRLQASGRVMAAAELIDKKLGRRDQVMTLLWSQWPRGHDSVATATRAFELLAESGEHAETRNRIRWLAETGTDPLAAATVYRSVAKTTPDENVRLEAEDACRIAAVESIAHASPMEVDQRMDLVSTLDDPSQLIARDARRYSERLREQRTPPKPESAARATVDRGVHLDLERVVQGNWELVLFADHHANQLRLLGLRGGNAVLECTPLRLGSAGVYPLNELELHRHPEIAFQSCDQPPGTLLLYGTDPTQNTPALSAEFLNVDQSPFNVDRLAVCTTGQLVGITFAEGGWLSFGRVIDGAIVHDRMIDASHLLYDVAVRQGPYHKDMIRLIAVDRDVFLIGGDMVARADEPLKWMNSFRAPPRWVDASLPYTRKRFAVADEQGIAVYWIEGDSLNLDVIAEGDYTRVKLLHGGRLLAVNDRQLELYQATRNGYKRLESTPNRVDKPIVAILPRPQRFEIVYESGEVHFWRLGQE